MPEIYKYLCKTGCYDTGVQKKKMWYSYHQSPFFSYQTNRNKAVNSKLHINFFIIRLKYGFG